MNNGLLAQIYSFGNTTRNKLRGLLDDPVGTLQQAADAAASGLNNLTGKQEVEQQFALRDRIKAGDRNALAEYKQLGDKFNQKMLNLALDSNPAAVGMFIGKSAKTWDAVAAAEAEKRLAAGDDARKVWSELGVFRGPDGHLRQEIPDNNIPQKLRLDEKQLLSYPEMKDSLPHKQLYQAYPETANIRLAPVLGDELGHLDSSQNVIGLKPIGAGDFTPAASQQRSSTQIHELQHAIQQREGWAKGGSPEQMAVEKAKAKNDWDYWSNIAAIRQEAERNGGNIDKAAKEIGELFDFQPTLEHRMAALNTPLKTLQTKAEQAQSAMFPYSEHEAYRRLAGEAEARATQARMNMDMAQRRATFPLDSYDVPVNQLIIRGGLLK